LEETISFTQSINVPATFLRREMSTTDSHTEKKVRQLSKISTGLGLSGLYLFALGAWMSTSMANVGLGLMLLAFILQLPAFPFVWRDGLFIVSLAFALYLVLRTVLAIWELPGTREVQVDHAWDLFRLGFLPTVVVGFWLSRYPHRVFDLLGLALAGFLIRIVVEVETSQLFGFLAGERATVGMSPNAFGLYCAVSVLGLVLLVRRFWGGRQNQTFLILRVLTWLAAMIIVTQGLIFSQSRGAWLASLIIFPPVLVIQILAWLRVENRRSKKRAFWFGFVALILTSLLIIFNKDVIKNRVSFEVDSLEAISSGDLTNLPPDAYGLRVYWWKLGLEKWMERPLLGWGPGTAKYLMGHIDNEMIRQLGYTDFHNSYVQMLVQIGLVGTAFFVVSLWLIFKTAWQGYKASWLSRDVFLFTVGALALFLIASMANMRTKDHFGRFHLALFGGIAYSYRLRRPTITNKHSDAAVKTD
jgi:O-antigen ligase